MRPAKVAERKGFATAPPPVPRRRPKAPAALQSNHAVAATWSGVRHRQGWPVPTVRELLCCFGCVGQIRWRQGCSLQEKVVWSWGSEVYKGRLCYPEVLDAKPTRGQDHLQLCLSFGREVGARRWAAVVLGPGGGVRPAGPGLCGAGGGGWGGDDSCAPDCNGQQEKKR
mgnify:CR=1 FL=1